MALSLKQKVFPYLVVLAGCALCLGPITLTFSCAGIFYTPVSQALGVDTGTFAMYMTFFYLSQTVALPFFGPIMEKFDLRVVLSVSVLLMGIPLMAMSQFNAVWQFYVAGVFIGIGDAPILYLAVSTLMTRWFEKRVGFYVGICMAFTGIGGVIFNPIGGALIASGPDGWRLGYFVFGVLLLVIALPFTMFGLRSRPSEIGLYPVGSMEWRVQAGQATDDDLRETGAIHAVSSQERSEADARHEEEGKTGKPSSIYGGVTAKEALRMPSFYAMMLFAVCVTSMVMFYLFFPSYATSLGATYPEVAALSATLAAMTMGGQAVGKVLLGSVGDRSVKAGLVVAVLCGMVGIASLWLLPGFIPLFLCAGFLYGILYAAETVQMPLMARKIFGTREYSSIYSRISTASSLSGVVFASAWGFVIDGAGYPVAFAMAFGVLIVLLCSGLFALGKVNARFGDRA